MSDQCENKKCKAKKQENLYHRTKYAGGPENGGWLCLNCYQDEFGEFGKRPTEVESDEVMAEEEFLPNEHEADQDETENSAGNAIEDERLELV